MFGMVDYEIDSMKLQKVQIEIAISRFNDDNEAVPIDIAMEHRSICKRLNSAILDSRLPTYIEEMISC